MSNEWTPIDVDYLSNPVMVAAGADGKLLHLAGLCYAQRHTTDGHIPKAVVPVLLAQAPAKKATVTRLVELGRWVDEGDTYRIHGWHDWNDPAVEVAARKERERQRKADWRRRKRDASPTTGRDAGRDASRDATGPREPSPAPRPATPSSSGTHASGTASDHDEDPRIALALERVARRRAAAAGQAAPSARYIARCIENLRSEEQLDVDAARLCETYPTAPTDLLAASLLGEDARNLTHFRRPA